MNSASTLPPVLEPELTATLGEPVLLCSPTGGGCIANATSLRTSTSRYFLKWGPAPTGDTFPAEADGLRLLHAADSPLLIPRPLAVRAPAGYRPGYLLMEWVECGAPGPEFWVSLGRGLAALHRSTDARYGAERDNFIGRLPQRNGWMERWPDFFSTSRLQPQASLARCNGRWRKEWDTLFEQLLFRLDTLLPATPEASVLHGDLWSGNYLAASDGHAALVDPAAYYGHRETDLAMTELFGGFPASFYAAYREAWPLEPSYEERREVYNFYHLINHLNHFGEGYASSVEAILKRFG